MFTAFSRLPTELQDTIWKYAAVISSEEAETRVQRVQLLPRRPWLELKDHMAEGPHFPKRLQIRNEVYPVPPLLHACSASRRAAQRYGAWKLWQTTFGRGYIYVNTEKDIFYFINTGGILYVVLTFEGVDMLCEHGHGAGPIGFDMVCPLKELLDLRHVAFDGDALITRQYRDMYMKIYPWMKLWLWPKELTVVLDENIGVLSLKAWRPRDDQKCTLRFVDDEFLKSKGLMAVKEFEQILLAQQLSQGDNLPDTRLCAHVWKDILKKKELEAQLQDGIEGLQEDAKFPRFQYALCIPEGGGDSKKETWHDEQWWVDNISNGYESDSDDDAAFEEYVAEIVAFEQKALDSQIITRHPEEGTRGRRPCRSKARRTRYSE